MRSEDYYIDLSNRARAYEGSCYPYTSENLGRASVLKNLRIAMWELVDENRRQAIEIERLKALLDEREAKE